MAEDLIGKGWGFPIKPGPDGRLAFLGGPEKVLQSIWIILSTAPGEREMLPDFGCSIHDLVFEANTSTLRSLVRDKVKEALIRWEPRIDVIEVEVENAPGQPNHLLIQIEYALRANNAIYNMVYPFFINEGAS